MSQDPLIEAATRLADVLVAENTALKALDFPAAGRLLAQKQAATSDLTAAQAGALFAPVGMRAVALRVTELAEENRRLLQHAIAVQGRVLGTVVRAVQTAVAPEPHYGPGGAVTVRRRLAVALRANA